MVLAHNEEKHILRCLEGLKAAEPENYFKVRVFVMANGCTDGTEKIVNDYATDNPNINLISIEMADKNNAWNTFIHDTCSKYCPDSDVYFFMDGDATLGAGALTALSRGLEDREEAHAASAIPITGRSKDIDAAEILENNGLVANLYALRGSFVRKLIDRSVRLPLGLEGDDGLIGALIKWDLDPTTDWNHKRITPCADAGFGYESMSFWSVTDWRIYWRRLIRYERRRYEFELLGPRLKVKGLSGLPQHISEVYGEIDKCNIQWGGLKPLTSYLALQEMKKASLSHNILRP